jgi:hypothetical protein
VNVPPGLEVIGPWAFAGTSSLRKFDFSCLSPHAFVGTEAFQSSGLVEVVFSDRLGDICERVVDSCIRLVSVRLPRELGSLHESVFANCSSLESLAIGDVGAWTRDSRDPQTASVGDGKLDGLKRIELIGQNFDCLDHQVIARWLSHGGRVVSKAFAGRTIDGIAIVADSEC